MALSTVLALVCPDAALAGTLDLSLRGLGRPDLDPTANDRLKGLSGELALALAPRPLQPAETLGLSGFELSIATSTSAISADAPYWQGQPGSPIIESGHPVPKGLWIPTLHLRKGLPLSTELGLQATYLANSQMFMVGAELKIALHEQFIQYLPALSVRFAAARLFGSTDLEMFTLEGDAMVSYAWGLGGMAELTPYLGYGLLGAHVTTAILDETPYLVTDPADQKGGTDGSLYSFPTLEWTKNYHTRVFGGLRLGVAGFELLYELSYSQTPFGAGQVTGHSLKLGFDL